MPGVSQEFERLRARIHNLPADICRQGGDIMREELIKAAEQDTNDTLRLRNVWWQNFDLDVSVDVTGSEGHSTCVLAPKPLRGGGAIWSWLENGTRPHAVGLSKKGRRKKLLINGTDWRTGPTRPTVHKPAVGTWSRGVTEGAHRVIDLANELFGEALNG